ncbi:MAG: hypothetical protein HKN19_19610 [Halioglobus sp.]|nr:hypothetical protein [Halioglobus sp.]
MDAVLIILGILGVGAIVVSAYVFTVAARNYVSEDHKRYGRGPDPAHFVERSPVDRRSGRPVTFPLTVNGILIAHDRRVLPDRRAPSY